MLIAKYPSNPDWDSFAGSNVPTSLASSSFKNFLCSKRFFSNRNFLAARETRTKLVKIFCELNFLLLSGINRSRANIK